MQRQNAIIISIALAAPLLCTGCFMGADQSDDNLPQTESRCDDGLDDDGDGRVDCADPDCAGFLVCQSDGVEICDNGLDDDEDGKTDCRDNDCAGASACTKSLDEDCANGVDDDNDGRVDCMDPDCAHCPHCRPQDEICDNGQDDDEDGKTDCEDEQDCRQHIACRPQNSCCHTHDTPGCFDASIEACVCAQNSYCCEMKWDDICVAQVTEFGCGECLPQTETACGNGIDDDGDGLLDCLDSDCSQAASCSCEQAHDSPGCADPAVEACVCAENCYCCEMQWDSVCVAQAQQLGCYE
jgi:hypothetical protein